jgi:Uma2 family endonuclease
LANDGRRADISDRAVRDVDELRGHNECYVLGMTLAATLDPMRALIVAPDPEWLEERRRFGVDGQDEVWDGVLHVPPDPTNDHQRFEGLLEYVLRPLVVARGLEIYHQISIFDPRDHKRNYRRPDITVIDPVHLLPRGTEGPVALAIEVLSPDDESREKLPYYAARGVQELWLVDPATRAFEVYTLRGAEYFAIVANASGVVRAPALGLELSVISGPKLLVRWDGGSAEL